MKVETMNHHPNG